MSAVCPNGHTSEADDYCDTCGSPIDASAQPAASAASAAPVAPVAPVASGAAAAGSRAPAGSTGSTGSSGSAGSSGSGSPEPQEGSTFGMPVGGRSSLDLDAPDASGTEAPEAPTAPPAPTAVECPNCGTENPDGALFCEACGYDFTTGAMPRDTGGGSAAGEPGAASGVASGATPAQAEPFEWLAEVWVDPDWYQTQEAEDPCPSPGLPVIMPLRHKSVLLGRVSTSRNTHPEIDLSSDPGVSRRHAQLTTDGTRWFVEDLGSSNGTYVGPASGPLPDHAIAVGPKTELGDDDRLYVGAWTRVVVRRATPDEVDAYA